MLTAKKRTRFYVQYYTKIFAIIEIKNQLGG